MFIYLTILNLVRFLTEDAPIPKEYETNVQVISAMYAWNHSDFLYVRKKKDKEQWELLE